MLKFNLVPKAPCIFGHNREVNLGSLSKKIEISTPYNLTTSFTYNLVNWIYHLNGHEQC